MIFWSVSYTHLDVYKRQLAGFAAGVMVAASIWSLLIPAIAQSDHMGKLSFLPALAGFWAGVLFLLLLDRLIPHLHVGSDQAAVSYTHLDVYKRQGRNTEWHPPECSRWRQSAARGCRRACSRRF